ncbi:MAG: DUF481 domain-containing protein [Planctomycetes bacterium]|uniref:DUF481 domain-containing protein n=1 Tax=Candidatus Wunengus sp. YC65 TaxID=3367701 RepID=UPI001D36B17C|nr:DUF481 domain-containing protein [Planctomycetota bacterium]
MKNHYLTTITTVLIFLSLMDSIFADDIKTIDGNIIVGEIVGVDEEYVSVKQGQDSMVFIQWRIVSLISRNKEIIIVSHENNRKKFSILTTSSNNFSVKDISFKTTDKIQDIYPEKIIANRSSFLQEREQSEQGVAHVPFSPSQLKPQNAPRQNTAQQKKPWKGNVDAGLTIQKGNKEALTTNAKTEFSQERTKDNMYFTGLLLFETKDSVRNADEQRGTLKYERKHKRRLYSFYQESVEHDEIEKLNLRSITSTGFGYRFIERERLKYKSEIGPSFTYERFRDDIHQTSPGLRIGNSLDWQILPSTLFYFKVDFLPVPEDVADWRLESDMGLRHNLTKSLSLNLNWINQYDNKTSAENVSKNDATILSTIGYNF